MTDPLWQPSAGRIAAANITAFMRAVEDRWNSVIPDYDALHRFSLDEMEKFYLSLWDFCGVIAETRGERVLVDGDRMPGARFFPDARLNYAENLLRRRDDGPALLFRAEDRVRREMSWRELHAAVSRVAAALQAAGLQPGDRVGGFVPNAPETIVAALAVMALGGVWTSCSPDFGVQGVLDRFGQVEPRILFATEGYAYNGKSIDVLPKLAEIASRLPSVERVVVFPLLRERADLSAVPHAVHWADFIAPHPAGEIPFRRLPFDHPLYILYSSGTTGAPKCIVHGAGGSLLQNLKEHRLHCDMKPGDRVFYFTTCGWMMWNWLVGALASEATLALYDGSPTYPGPETLWDYAESAGINQFGTSAKYIDGLNNAGFRAIGRYRLPALRVIASTGSPLVPEGFDYVYRNLKKDVHLASISGGTDIFGCFVAGIPIAPVWRGEIQGPCLGMATTVFDEDGNPVQGEKGELVCTRPFPTVPLGFWNDPDGKRFHDAYFARFPNIWCHGDFAEITPRGGFVIYGRSDATLNPGGVRIGTAEIYRQVERMDEILEAICIGQDWERDTRIVLFVRLAPGVVLDEALTARIRTRIRENCSPRHVPAKVIAVADIPRTKSGKITELAVRDVVHGRPVKNTEALDNPQALDLYRDLPQLRT
ncbi:MAG: acetoacetate--CoA ligase [Alphaproteobacteria bacterium]